MLSTSKNLNANFEKLERYIFSYYFELNNPFFYLFYEKTLFYKYKSYLSGSKI